MIITLSVTRKILSPGNLSEEKCQSSKLIQIGTLLELQGHYTAHIRKPNTQMDWGADAVHVPYLEWSETRRSFITTVL